MSIRGINFTNQEFTASDHGAVFGCMLGDGWLVKGGLSINGRSVVVKNGIFIAGGRAIEFSGNQSVSISETSGYARIKVRINLGGVSTESQFNVVSVMYDVANSTSAFPVLTQEEINGDGLIYEASLGIVNLGGTLSINSTCGNSHYNWHTSVITINTTDWDSSLLATKAGGIPFSVTPIVTFHPDSYSTWVDYGIRSTKVENGEVTFKCDAKPSAAVKAMVVW